MSHSLVKNMPSLTASAALFANMTSRVKSLDSIIRLHLAILHTLWHHVAIATVCMRHDVVWRRRA